MNRKMIYDFKEHGLYYYPPLGSNPNEEKIVLAMGTLQLEFDYKSRQLLSVFGFLPLIKSKKEEIKIPNFTIGKFLTTLQLSKLKYQKGIAYDYFDFFPSSKDDFILNDIPIITYDDESKIILLGNHQNSIKFIKIDDNIICGCDLSGDLKSLIILPDETIIK